MSSLICFLDQTTVIRSGQNVVAYRFAVVLSYHDGSRGTALSRVCTSLPHSFSTSFMPCIHNNTSRAYHVVTLPILRISHKYGDLTDTAPVDRCKEDRRPRFPLLRRQTNQCKSKKPQYHARTLGSEVRVKRKKKRKDERKNERSYGKRNMPSCDPSGVPASRRRVSA